MKRTTPTPVLFISHDTNLSGAEISLLRFVSHLDRTRFAPSVLVPGEGPLNKLLERHGIPFYIAPYHMVVDVDWDNPGILSQGAAIRDACLALCPTLVVVNTNTLPQAVMAVVTTDIPLMVHVHAFIVKHQYQHLSPKVRSADKMWLNAAEKLIACSPWTAKFYQELLDRDVEAISNTTPIPQSFVPYGDQQTDTPRISMLATIEPHKRPDMFIKATALIHKQLPQLPFHCHLYGSGFEGYVQELRADIEREGIGHLFEFKAKSSDIETLYNQSSIIYMPSDIEPFSMVTIEAASYARPIVATRSGGPDDLIIDGKTGFLVDVGDVETSAKRLTYLLNNPTFAQKMGEAARQHFLQKYAPDAVLPLYETALLETLERTPEQILRRQTLAPFAQYWLNRVSAF